METNTLVRHKKLNSLGIGCVSKEMKTSVKVNFGTDDCITVKRSMLIPVDVSKAKTVSFSVFQNRILSEKSKLNKCIVGNELKEYVGIGWISLKVVEEEDLLKYPRVI